MTWMPIARSNPPSITTRLRSMPRIVRKGSHGDRLLIDAGIISTMPPGSAASTASWIVAASFGNQDRLGEPAGDGLAPRSDVAVAPAGARPPRARRPPCRSRARRGTRRSTRGRPVPPTSCPTRRRARGRPSPTNRHRPARCAQSARPSSTRRCRRARPARRRGEQVVDRADRGAVALGARGRRRDRESRQCAGEHERDRAAAGHRSRTLAPGRRPSSAESTLVAMTPERLTSLDASFLYLETPAVHMHVAGDLGLRSARRRPPHLR